MEENIPGKNNLIDNKELIERKGKFIWVALFTLSVIIISIGINWVSNNIEDKKYEDIELVKLPSYCEYYCFDVRDNKTKTITDGETSNYMTFSNEGCELNCTSDYVYRVINRKSYRGKGKDDDICGSIFTPYHQLETLPGRVHQSS